jgi:hypothetical protein
MAAEGHFFSDSLNIGIGAAGFLRISWTPSKRDRIDRLSIDRHTLMHTSRHTTATRHEEVVGSCLAEAGHPPDETMTFENSTTIYPVGRPWSPLEHEPPCCQPAWCIPPPPRMRRTRRTPEKNLCTASDYCITRSQSAMGPLGRHRSAAMLSHLGRYRRRAEEVARVRESYTRLCGSVACNEPMAAYAARAKPRRICSVVFGFNTI